MNCRKLPSLFITSLCFGWSALVLAAPGMVTNEQNEQENELEEIIVTGSRLASAKVQSTPLTTIDQNTLAAAVHLHLSRFLYDLPLVGQAPNSLATGGFNTVSAGLSTVDLRGLGANRTLVLVDGKRLVGGDASNPSVADLNAVPSQLLQRVEVYSGGATAIYGSGAIAGVVNLITDDHYQGLTLTAQRGSSERDDGGEALLSLSGGGAFAGGLGHALFNLTWDRSDAIYSRDRGFSATNERLGDRQYFSQFTPSGTIVSNAGWRVPNAQGQWLNTYTNDQYGFNQADYRQLQIPLERKQWNFFSKFDITPRYQAYVRFSGSANDSSNQQEPSPLILNNRPEPLASTYPFFPPEILATWTDNGEPVPAQIQYFRRLNELGPRRYEQERNTWRVVSGITAQFGTWQSDLSYQWSRNDFLQIATGHYNTLYLAQGLDLEVDPEQPGRFRCASVVARNLGCVALDLFAEAGLSPAAIDYIDASQSLDATLEIEELQWTVQGPLVALPAGDIHWLLGVNFRRESIATHIDSLTQSGLSSSVVLSPINGDDRIDEAFTEMDIPLLNKQGFDYLGLSLAYRYSHYDSIGDAESWNAALTLSPLRSLDIYLRNSRAIRAPSIGELYLPPRGGYLNVADPCAQGAFPDNEQVSRNCQSLGIPADYNPSALELSTPYRLAGNKSLQEEAGDTTTVGMAYRPWRNTALTLRWDYFDIEIQDAIATVDPLFKINNCYAASDFPDSRFCRGLNRAGEEENYRFTLIEFGAENIGAIETRGSDFELSSIVPMLGGDLSNQVLLTYTDQWRETANNRTLNRLNEPGSQRWKGLYRLGYSKGPWQGILTSRYLGDAVIENDSAQPYIRDNNDLPSMLYFDGYLAYQFGRESRFSESQQYQMYLGINNLLDKSPPYVPGDSRSGTRGTSTAAGSYDIRGRFISAGIKVVL